MKRLAGVAVMAVVARMIGRQVVRTHRLDAQTLGVGGATEVGRPASRFGCQRALSLQFPQEHALCAGEEVRQR